MSVRQDKMHAWLRKTLDIRDYTLEPASVDASFRSYHRLQFDSQSYIIMDAPPENENCLPFIDVSHRLLNAGVNVPVIEHQDTDQGFIMLTDLGTELYLNVLNDNNADNLYEDAIKTIRRMQSHASTVNLPPYDENLLRKEMQLFNDWLLGKHLNIKLDSSSEKELQNIQVLLIDSALSQPQVFVHRDYHSRNLMYCPGNNPGVIDYQDAVYGPVTYDLVSLLKDCYIKWPTQRIQNWIQVFLQYDENHRFSSSQFTRWFDLMGVQRHLKASGIFARLYHRDHKPGFLKDIPRTLSYITDLENNYPELKFLVELINSAVSNKLAEANQKCAP